MKEKKSREKEVEEESESTAGMLGAHGRGLADPPPLAKIPKPHDTEQRVSGHQLRRLYQPTSLLSVFTQESVVIAAKTRLSFPHSLSVKILTIHLF